MDKSWAELARAQRNYILRLLNGEASRLDVKSKDFKSNTEAIQAAIEALNEATMFPVSKSK